MKYSLETSALKHYLNSFKNQTNKNFSNGIKDSLSIVEGIQELISFTSKQYNVSTDHVRSGRCGVWLLNGVSIN